MTETVPEWAGLAVDIGNSKADIAVISADGQRISWVRCGTLTPQRLGWDGCAASIVRELDKVTGNPGAQISAAWIAVAGVDFPEEEARLTRALVATGRFATVTVRNDATPYWPAEADSTTASASSPAPE